tara:strand:- start:735 stop:911 length:177 start_codon:yes stop_codon:yes gene_type:complete
MNKEIIRMIEKRLELGQKKYGSDIDPDDGRDWGKESIEELLDCIVYLTTELIRINKKR